jgi:hypothetical protein
MRALALFYSSTPKIDTEDFYAGETSSDVVVSVTFQDLSEDAKKLFSSYIQGDELTVERVFTCNEGRISAKYHGATLQHKGFDPVRVGLEVKDRGKTARSAYDALRGKPEYSSLPEWSALAAVPDALKGWEAANPDKCTRQRDDGQFFGFSEVAQGYLGKFTRMLFIPAVRDAADDAAEGRNTVLSGLMDLVVRSVLANREALKKLREETQKQFSEILDPTKLTELVGLSERLTTTLKTFVPDSSVELKWLPLQDLDFPLPKADVKLVEDGYSSAVARTGHGLQRAFIMTCPFGKPA